jgi:MGT family glycosyltransferase
MAHIAFFAPAAAGHINPTLGMVAELTARGHRVSFATTDEYAPRVADAGAEVVRFDTTIEPPPDKPFKLNGTDLSRGLMANVKETYAQVAALRGWHRENRPDLIVFDGLAAWWGRLIARELDVPCMAVWTTFVSNKEWSLMGPYIKPNPLDPRLWRFGFEIMRMARKARLTMAELVDAVGTGVRGHFVFMPRSFQFKGDTFGPEFHFVGPCLHERTSQGHWEPPGCGRPVLLVSLGTIYTAKPEFFANVVEAVRDEPWHTVIALSDRVDRSVLGELPEHVEVHDSVPQMAVLPHTRLFINHAGITSVMEAVHSEVPMIAVPQQVEQRATADRMEAVGIGRQLRPAATSVDALRRMIREVAADTTIADALTAFHRELKDAGGTAAAVTEIERVLAAEGTR